MCNDKAVIFGYVTHSHLPNDKQPPNLSMYLKDYPHLKIDSICVESICKTFEWIYFTPLLTRDTKVDEIHN